MWDLCLALWGRLRGVTAEDEEEESRPQRGPDSHEVTMLRREAVSEWLREVVAPSVREDVRRAKARGGGNGSVVDQGCNSIDIYKFGCKSVTSSGTTSLLGHCWDLFWDRFWEEKCLSIESSHQILAHLSGNEVGEACSVAHRTGNHYAALVAASAAGGGAASVHGELVLQQLEGYQQMRADRYGWRKG